jgi:hypothetical protein
MSAMSYKEIAHFERLLKSWGFGDMIKSSHAFAEGMKKLQEHLYANIDEEYNDYCFVDEHMGEYYDLLFENEEHLSLYDWEMKHGCGVDGRALFMKTGY